LKWLSVAPHIFLRFTQIDFVKCKERIRDCIVSFSDQFICSVIISQLEVLKPHNLTPKSLMILVTFMASLNLIGTQISYENAT